MSLLLSVSLQQQKYKTYLYVEKHMLLVLVKLQHQKYRIPRSHTPPPPPPPPQDKYLRFHLILPSTS
jgi:hypothetical protein